jgi:hypothetical protein
LDFFALGLLLVLFMSELRRVVKGGK